MKRQDMFDGPNCRALLERACKRNDRQLMRLLGQDLDLETRLNTGFLRPDEELWAEWRAAERIPEDISSAVSTDVTIDHL